MNKTKGIAKTTPQKTEFGTLKLVVIQPTTFCNLNCDYCYLPDRQSKHRLSLDLLEPIFTNLFKSKFLGEAFTVVWHAGEPLTVPISFYEAAFQKIEELNGNRCTISHSIQSNGTVINKAWCDLIKKYRVDISKNL